MKYDIHTLKNGLRVILVPLKDTNTATVVIMVGTGSRYESERENGLAHFLEHMFFKGTVKRPNAKAIAEELDAIGAQNNAFTAKNRTAYYAKADSVHVEKILDVISDMYLNSTLPQREIIKERGTIIQEINMYQDLPMRVVHEVFDGLIFGYDHPLGRDIIGTKKNILSFKRRDFRDYLNRAYVADNTVVCVAGKFPKGKVLKAIQKDFKHMRVGKVPEFEVKQITQSRAQVAIRNKKTDQSHLVLGTPAFEFGHRDEYSATLLSVILGGGMSSRLFTEVREKRGLAYTVKSSIDKYVDVGHFSIYAGVEHKNLELTIKTILAEMKKLKEISVSSRELKKAKEYIKGHLALSLETTDSIAFTAAEGMILIDKILTLEEIKKKIDAVKVSDIKRVAIYMFQTSKLNLAIIGPYNNKTKLEKLLKV
jgi:predicted Zn-dependent peptidase